MLWTECVIMDGWRQCGKIEVGIVCVSGVSALFFFCLSPWPPKYLGMALIITTKYCCLANMNLDSETEEKREKEQWNSPHLYRL